MLPLVDKLPILIEDLDTHVAAIGDQQASLRIDGDVMRRSKFNAPRAELAEGLDKPAVAGKLRNAREGVRG